MDCQPKSAPRQRDAGPQEAAEGPEVRPLGDERRHYWLALEMSRTVGLDLQAALDTGRIDHGEWAEMVTRCRGCGWADGCPAWMEAARLAAETGDAAAVSEAPGACANADRFNTLLALPAEEGPSR